MNDRRKAGSRSKHIASLFFAFAFIAAGISSVKRMTASADNLPSSPSAKPGKSPIAADDEANPPAPTDADATSTPKATPSRMERVVSDSLEAGFEEYDATAYCLTGSTASGVQTREGVIAADPRVIPMGSVVHIRAGKYSGTYLAVDTGGRIRGHLIDIFMRDIKEARLFGRRKIRLKVIGRTVPSHLREKGPID